MKKFLITMGTTVALLLGAGSGALAASNTYKVKGGDTLSQIAKNYKISVTELKQWNKLTSDHIIVNQILNITQPSVTASAKSSTVKVLTVSASAYTLTCKNCSGKTAIGINLKKNPNQKVISVDPKVIKLGTKVYVEGYGYAIAADTGGSIKGNKIDVFFPTLSQALKWGRKTIKIQILN